MRPSTVVLLLLLCAVAAAIAGASAPAAGHPLWKHDSIVNLTRNFTTYETEHVWYGSVDGAAGIVNTLSPNQSAANPTPMVQVSRTASAAGWDLIRFTTIYTGNANLSYFAVGYVEGATTFDAIYHTWVNMIAQVQQQFNGIQQAVDFVDQHLAWEADHETATPFGAQLSKQLLLVKGMYQGWLAEYDARKARGDASVANMTRLDFNAIYFISWQDEVTNVIAKYSPTAQKEQTQSPSTNYGAMHCSALMKLTKDDFFFAHDTWSSFNTMLRQFKTYVMPEATVSMSGYPGSFSSTDDFYMTSHDMAVTETTNGFYNTSLYELIVPQSVSEFHRVMIANFLATNASQWMGHFAHENSGTYNNQYMAANMKVVRDTLDAGLTDLPAGTFFVGEQIPGLVVYEDQTAFVNRERHWPSYNIPFYPEIYKRSGFAAYDTPSYWGTMNYHAYARGVIFKRMQGYVTDEASMFYMMRFNDWERDAASTIPWCVSPWTNGTVDCGATTQGAHFSIASRYDLNPTDAPGAPGNPGLTVNRALFGAIDTKMTSAFMMRDNKRVVVQNGPTWVQQPPFDHSAFIAANPGKSWGPWSGLANTFDFPPAEFMPV